MCTWITDEQMLFLDELLEATVNKVLIVPILAERFDLTLIDARAVLTHWLQIQREAA